MRLYSWEYLLIFLPVLGYIVYLFFYNKKFKYYATIKYPAVSRLKQIATTPRTKLRKYLIVLKIAALFFMILALARPQSGRGFGPERPLGLQPSGDGEVLPGPLSGGGERFYSSYPPAPRPAPRLFLPGQSLSVSPAPEGEGHCRFSPGLPVGAPPLLHGIRETGDRLFVSLNRSNLPANLKLLQSGLGGKLS